MLILHLSQLPVISRLLIKQPVAFLLLTQIDLQRPLLGDRGSSGYLSFQCKSVPLHAEDNSRWNEATAFIRCRWNLFL